MLSGPITRLPPLWLGNDVMRDLQELAAGRDVGDVALHRVLDDVNVAGAVGVVDVELRAVGREHESEQALFVAGRERGQAEHRAGDVAGGSDRHDRAGLLGDVDGRRLAGAPRQRDRAVEARRDLPQLDLRGPEAGRRCVVRRDRCECVRRDRDRACDQRENECGPQPPHARSIGRYVGPCRPARRSAHDRRHEPRDA